MKPAPLLIRWFLNFVKKGAVTLPPWGIYFLAGHEYVEPHEKVHWQQYERMGAFRFYVIYLWYMVRYGYELHPMEIEARTISGIR
jgi:hypothetical protein